MIELHATISPESFATALVGRVRISIAGRRGDPRPRRIVLNEDGTGRFVVLPIPARTIQRALIRADIPVVTRVDPTKLIGPRMMVVAGWVWINPPELQGAMRRWEAMRWGDSGR